MKHVQYWNEEKESHLGSLKALDVRRKNRDSTEALIAGMASWVKESIRPSVDGSPVLAHLASLPRKDQKAAWNLRARAREFSSLGVVSIANLTEILSVKWDKVEPFMVQWVAERLEKDGFFQHLLGTWRVCARKPAPAPAFPVSLTPRGGYRKQHIKAGVCPTCGKQAQNKNRHANSEHRAEECRANVCRANLES